MILTGVTIQNQFIARGLHSATGAGVVGGRPGGGGGGVGAPTNKDINEPPGPRPPRAGVRGQLDPGEGARLTMKGCQRGTINPQRSTANVGTLYQRSGASPWIWRDYGHDSYTTAG